MAGGSRAPLPGYVANDGSICLLAVLYNPTVIGLALEIEDLTLYGSPGIGFTHQSEIYSPLLRPAADGKAADMAPGSHGARSAEPDGQVGCQMPDQAGRNQKPTSTGPAEAVPTGLPRHHR